MLCKLLLIWEWVKVWLVSIVQLVPAGRCNYTLWEQKTYFHLFKVSVFWLNRLIGSNKQIAWISFSVIRSFSVNSTRGLIFILKAMAVYLLSNPIFCIESQNDNFHLKFEAKLWRENTLERLQNLFFFFLHIEIGR